MKVFVFVYAKLVSCGQEVIVQLGKICGPHADMTGHSQGDSDPQEATVKTIIISIHAMQAPIELIE